MFHFDAPLVVGPEVSKTRFASWDTRHPAVFSGGLELRNWRRVDGPNGPAWAATVPDAPRYRQLWLDGERRLPIAEVPERRLAGLLPDDAKAPWNVGQTSVEFHPSDVPPIARREDVEFVGVHLWAESRMGLREIDRTNAVFRFDRKSTFRLTDGDVPATYRLENVAEELGIHGDWCYDRANHRILVAGRAPRLAVVSMCPTLLVVRGATGLALDNLVFRYTEWSPLAASAGDGQAAISVPGAVELDACNRLSVRNCRLEHLGTYAIEVKGGAQNEARNCDMTDLGGGGVKIGPGAVQTNLVGCRMIGLGRIFASAVGVWIGDSGQNTVARNTIRDLYYTAISVGWTWGYGVSHASGNRILDNDLSDIGQGRLSDMGGIYTLGVSPHTALSGNRIRNVQSRTYGGWGIYLDEGSSNIHVTGNLVMDTKTGSFHQHYGQDNLVEGNVFINAKHDGQLIRTRKEDHRSFVIQGNVVVWHDAPLLGSNWDGLFDINRNLYWRTDGKPITFAGKSLAEWRALGHDQDSMIADPQMTVSDAGVHFAEGSPARQLGMTNLDMRNVGARRLPVAFREPD
jgi:hypothetical protein